MHRAGRRLLAVAVGICLLGAPIIAHIAIATQRGLAAAAILVVAQAAMLGWLLASRVMSCCGTRGSMRLPVQVCAGALVALLTILIWRESSDGLVTASALPHALVYLALLVVFIDTLSPGKTPVITVIATRARGRLTPVLERYTRGVTIAWCLFFMTQLLLSFGLWLLAPLAWWQMFLNVLTLPMVALMFCAELAYRSWRHGIHIPDGEGGTLARMRHMAAQFRAPLHQSEPKS